jgi:hypothetical protein
MQVIRLGLEERRMQVVETFKRAEEMEEKEEKGGKGKIFEGGWLRRAS